MNSEKDFLIICNSPKQAHDLYRSTVERCLNDKITIERASQCTYTIHLVDLTIRFISEARAGEAIRGFHGSIRSGWEFERFLELAKLYEFF